MKFKLLKEYYSFHENVGQRDARQQVLNSSLLFFYLITLEGFFFNEIHGEKRST